MSDGGPQERCAQHAGVYYVFKNLRKVDLQHQGYRFTKVEGYSSRQLEELNRKYLADLDRECDEQKYAVSKVKDIYQAAIATKPVLPKWHSDGSRTVMHRFPAAEEQGREQMNDKIMSLIDMHEEEMKQMKVEHEHKVDHLYNKIEKLVIEKS
ncbi:MAG: hypothetical protein Q9170_001485 [Blastenia crenularia]